MSNAALQARTAPLSHDHPRRFVALSARLRASRLDRQLAAGVAPWTSSAHAARSLQLTADRQRAALASVLDSMIDTAHRPPVASTQMSTLIRPARRPVLECESLIVELAATLRSPVPVTAEGVAGLRDLLRRGGGPLYADGGAGSLEQSLRRIAACLPAPM